MGTPGRHYSGVMRTASTFLLVLCLLLLLLLPYFSPCPRPLLPFHLPSSPFSSYSSSLSPQPYRELRESHWDQASVSDLGRVQLLLPSYTSHHRAPTRAQVKRQLSRSQADTHTPTHTHTHTHLGSLRTICQNLHEDMEPPVSSYFILPVTHSKTLEKRHSCFSQCQKPTSVYTSGAWLVLKGMNQESMPKNSFSKFFCCH